MSSVSLLLIQVLVIIVCAQLLGLLAERVGQSKVIGEILAGILLGPSLFGQLSPTAYQFIFASTPGQSLAMLGEVGLILLMFQIGLEFETDHLKVRKNQSQALSIAAFGLALPFVLGMLLAWWSHPFIAPTQSLSGYALFVGIALSVTAVPVLVRMLTELGADQMHLGRIAILAAALTDVLAWLLLTVVIAVAKTDQFVATFFIQLALLLGFAAGCYFLLRPSLAALFRYLANQAQPSRQSPMAMMLVLALLSGLTTSIMGFHSAFGGLIMGLLLSQNKALVQQWKTEVTGLVNMLLMPLFFALAGSHAQFNNMGTWQDISWFLIFFAVAVIGKFGGCYVAARAGGMNHLQARVIGALMNTRGLMELVILTIGLD